MSDLLVRACQAFVVPRTEVARGERHPSASPPLRALAVLGTSEEAEAVGALLAMRARADRRAVATVLAVHRTDIPAVGQSRRGAPVSANATCADLDGPLSSLREPGGVATPNAASSSAVAAGSGPCRRLARSLDARGLDVSVSAGRLVRVSLPGCPREAVRDLHRIAAAAGEAPVVTVLTGPRDERFDDVLRQQDRIVLAVPSGSPAEAEALALTGLDGLGIPVAVVRGLPGRSTRLLARVGLLLPGLPTPEVAG